MSEMATEGVHEDAPLLARQHQIFEDLEWPTDRNLWIGTVLFQPHKYYCYCAAQLRAHHVLLLCVNTCIHMTDTKSKISRRHAAAQNDTVQCHVHKRCPTKRPEERENPDVCARSARIGEAGVLEI